MVRIKPQPVVLIAEQDALMRDVLCATVSRNGFRVAGPFASTSEVSGWMERWTPAVAILDAVLNDGSTADLAEAMRRRGVLVLIHEEVSGTSRPCSRNVEWGLAQRCIV